MYPPRELTEEEKLKNTRDEYEAYDRLPRVLRQFIRHAKTEVSARKVYGAWIRSEKNTRAVLERLKEWAKKQ